MKITDLFKLFGGAVSFFSNVTVCLIVLLITGCAAPDHWAVFENRSRQQVMEEGDLTPDISPDITPGITPNITIGVSENIQFPSIEEPLIDVIKTGEPVDLTIEQVAMLALENNRDLRVLQVNPLIAGTFEQIERGVYDPEVYAQVEYFDEQASETSRATGEQFGVKGSDTVTIAGVRQKLPSGTTVEATVEHDRNFSDRAPDQQTARVGLSITQSLLRGFGPAVNLVSVRQAKLDAVASVYELRGFTEALLAESETAYWHYVLAKQEIAIFERSLSVVKQQRDEIEQKIEVGILPKTEAAAARAQVATHEQALIDARSLLEERRLTLLRKISIGSDGRFDLKINAVSDPFVLPEPITDLSDRIRLADQSRPDLNEARLRLKQNRLETVVTRNGLLPELDLFAALGRTGYADNFSDSFRELDGNTYDFSAGVRLSSYIGNRAAKARDYAAKVSYRQAGHAVANLQQMIALEVRLAVNEVERTRQQIAASKVTRMLEQEKLQAEKERFDVGAGTSLLVAQAQRDLLISRIAEVRSVINYRIARVNLYLAEGSLLERRAVRIN